VRTLAKAMTSLVLAGVCSSAMAEWATGEIRRLDPENKRLTIKHGEIPSLDMPPMTMVFYVSDVALLNGLQVADQIEFRAAVDGKRNMVTAIRRK
jgi:Cu(I)/Ag(I) efflux system periplasmic protein CusF